MEWSRGPTIGRGASATVSIATVSTSGELFAVKSAELSRSSFLQREQHFLSQLSSPHLVKYMGFEITSENNNPMYNLFMEYVPGGTLSDSIKRQGGSLDESAIRSYTRQIVIGLDYLHLNGLVHCDIKGENLLIGENGLKIADFGCARWVDATSAIAGTPAFMAPEVARGEKQGFEADVWALGCTIIEMATGSHPWTETNDPVSALYRIGFSGDLPAFPAWFSDDATDFLSKCLKRDCEERWTAKQLLQHPFFDDPELNSPKVGEFTRNSPLSVLDQDFWESVETSEAHQDLTHVSSSSNSPAERIRRLIGGISLSNSSLPNWSEDEDWITVRNKEIEESLIVSAVDLEEFDDSIVSDEDLLAESSVTTINSFDFVSGTTDFVMHFERVEDVIVSRILTSMRNLMEVLFLFNLSVPAIPFPFESQSLADEIIF